MNFYSLVYKRLLAGARAVVARRGIRTLAFLGVCAAYMQGGLNKLLDFSGATAEMAHFGLAPAPVFAVLVILLELGASLMILTGFLRWLASLSTPRFMAVLGVRMFSWTALSCYSKLSTVHFRADCTQRQFDTTFVIPPDVSIHMLHEVFRRYT